MAVPSNSTMRHMILPPEQWKHSRSHCRDDAVLRRHMDCLRLAAALCAVLSCCFWNAAHGDVTADANGLAIFKQAVDKLNRLPWNGSDACTWPGITCRNVSAQASSRVVKVRLGKNGLSGAIPRGSLGQLTELRVLNLGSNDLSGVFPMDLANCGFLRNLYLQNNRFSGPLPSNFSSWPNLNRFDVSFNNFSGTVSPSLVAALRLDTLYLQNNSLTGSLPPLNSTLEYFNAANNHFTGPIPPAYEKFDRSFFLGNSLCGPPLADCPAQFAPPLSAALSSSKAVGKKKLGGGAIAGIVIGGAALLLLLCLLCCLVMKKSKSRGTQKKPNLYAARSVEGNGNVGGAGAKATNGEMDNLGAVVAPVPELDRKRLVFFDDTKHEFDLEDLLRASAEVLGKGSVGTSYKAVLESGTIVAVKRLKDVSMEKKDFDTKMQFLGNLKHSNLVPVIAYYHSREEKLLVSNYMTNGSLSALLHGNKVANSSPLDWDTRVGIALGVALGIQHLHEQHFEHGNIKSSNILLTSNYTGCVSDYGLTQLMSPSSAANRMVAYRAPEVTDIRKPTPKTDVYSFGVLLLELLTGRPPSQSSGVVHDLPLWVQSVERNEDDWHSKVFDPQLTKFQIMEGEMEHVLNVALDCVMASPDQRPTMAEVVERLENYK